MDGCVYRTKDGECDLYSEGGKFKAFCDPEHCDNIAPTNADRIRAMTDEELAMFLDDVQKYQVYPEPHKADDCGECMTDLCWQCWRDWLKQEATDES